MLPLTFIVFTLFSSVCASSLLSDFHVLVSLKDRFQFPEPLLNTWKTSYSSSFCSWAGIQCNQGRVSSLDFTDFNLHGSVSPAISTLDKLTHLSLAGNNFTATIHITNLTHLQFPNIYNNQFSGNIYWNYSNMDNLQLLDAYNNNFTSLIPMGLLNLKMLRYMDLGGNFFFGEIPRSYGNLVELEYLSLTGNDLRGKIPVELGNLTNLREIYLGYYNSYEGGIPVELGNLRSLVHMDLSCCDLVGPILKELGNLKELHALYLTFQAMHSLEKSLLTTSSNSSFSIFS